VAGEIMTPRQRFNARHQALVEARAPFDESYRQLGQYLLPWRMRWSESDRNKRELNSDILDPTGTLAVRTCAAGIAAGMFSAGRVWFRYGPPSSLLAANRASAVSPNVKRYLAECENIDREILARGNFYGVTSGSVLYDLVGFAIAGIFVEEDLRTVARCKPLPIGQYWLAAGADGEINTSSRRFTLTVAQLVEYFGLEAVSARVRDQYRRHQLDVEHQVGHIVEPNLRDQETGFEGMRAGNFDWRGMAYRSVWYEVGQPERDGEKFLRVAGFHEFPGVFPRWSRTSPEDVYGTGAGHQALPDIKQLQTMVKRKLQLVEKAAIPPLKGSSEISGFPSQLPGAFTRVPAGGGAEGRLEPIHVPEAAAIAQVREEIQVLQWTIRETLFADLWRVITDDERKQPSTAEEVRAKKEERLLQLGPVANNLEGEYARRVLDRHFYLAERAGMHPDPPPELADQEIKVEFVSIFSEAQKAQEIPAIERVAAFVQALSAIDPEIIDAPDADKFTDKYAEVAGLSPDLMRSAAERQRRRQERAQRQAEAQSAAAMAQGAATAKDLSGASLESDSALSRIVGTMGPLAAQSVATPEVTA
jgi:hypothetical protein